MFKDQRHNCDNNLFLDIWMLYLILINYTFGKIKDV